MPRDTNRSAAEQLTYWRILEHAREERRRIQRRVVNIDARIDVGGAILDCTVVDISGLGAKLAIEAANVLPDSFLLLLTPSGHPARRCHVTWRTDDNVGVEFEAENPALHLVH
jgi:hypothetical protein